MAGSLGTIAGQVKLDVAQAIAAFAATKAASAAQVGALESAGSRIAGFGGILLGAGTAMVAGFGLAIEAAASFDKKMSYVGGITHATGEEMNQVREKALQLGRDGQFSAGQIADGFVELAKAGISVKDMTTGMADAMTNLASAADVKLGTAVEDIIAQMHTYGLTTADASHISDELAGGMHASVISLDDMSNSLKYAGSVAHGLGISFDETTEATSLLGKAGIKGSSAGTQLRQIMVSLGGATKPAREELTKLGIITKDGSNQFFDSSGKAKSLAQIFQILQDHTRGLNQEQQLMAFRMIFNNRALAAAEILTNDGAAGFANMNAQISKTTAAEVAGKRLDNLKGDIQKLKGSIDTLMIQAGEPFQNMLRGIVQWVNKLINGFVSLSPNTQKLIMEIVGITGAALVFIGTALVVLGTIFKAVKIIKETYEAFKLLAAGIRIAAVATGEMTVALLTSPITWIVIAIVALAAAFYLAYTHSKTFRDIINAIGRGLKTAFFATIEWFKTLPKFFQNLWKDITHWFEIGVGWVKKNWDILLAIFTGPIGIIILIWRRFGDTIMNFFKSIPGAVVKFLSDAWNSFTAFVDKIPYYLGYAVGFVLGIIVRFGINMVKCFIQMGKDTIDAVVWTFTKLPVIIYDWLVKTGESIGKWAVDTYHSFKQWCDDSYHAIIDFFTKLPGEAENWFVRVNVAIVRWITKTYTDCVKWVSDTYRGIVNWFARLPAEIESYFLTMYYKAVNWLRNFFNDAANFGSNIYHAIVDFIEQIPDKIGEIMDNCINAFKSVVSDAFNAAKDFAGGLWDGFKKGLGINSPSLIEKQMWQITKVTGTETTRLAGHVKIMQNLANQINTSNPAKAAADANTTRISSLTKSMQVQAQMLHNAAAALLPTTGSFAVGMSMQASSGAPSSLPQTGLEALQGQRPINITVNNPIAERASDSAARKLRTLTAMGAF